MAKAMTKSQIVAAVAEKAEIARALERRVWPLFAAGQLKPIIFRTFPLAEANAAFAAAGDGRNLRVTLVP